MPGPEIDLKQQLFEAGNRLLKPLGSVDDLLALLDRVEKCLSYVEQQPPVEMQDALCPAFKALVINELLKHADIDVRVGVTACLTEISRITAPDVPYSDELMKEVFRLTISAFEGLSDNSSKSFAKRVSILETVARVRSCAVLLDLECDSLVVEMFRNFYKCIRDFHAANVFASMENIMTLVIEEYDGISTDLLFALLSVLKKENKDALPIAKRLGEKVVQKCAAKLKPCIVEAIKSLRINLLDYDFVVTLACQIVPDHNPLNENMLTVPLVNGDESATKAVEEEIVALAAPSLTMSIPSTSIVEDAAAEGQLNTSRKLDSNVVVCPTETIPDQIQVGQGALKSDMAMNPESVSLSKSEPLSEKVAKKRGRKPKNAKDIMHPDSSKLPQPEGNIEYSELPVSKATINMEVCNAHPADSSVEPNVPEKNCDSSNQPLSPKPVENNVATPGSPSLSDSPPEKSSSETITASKKAMSNQETASSLLITEKKAFDGLNNAETRFVSSEKDTPDGLVGDATNFVSLDEVNTQHNIEGESEDNPLKQSGLQFSVADGTLRTKKRGRPRKDAFMSAATGVKDGISSEGTSKKRSRLRFTLPEDGKEYAEDLVGSRIKVWWPQDKEYYDGIVESFDPVRKKHKILYTDNEREILNLHKEKWKLVKRSVGFDKAGVTYTTAGDASNTHDIKKSKTSSSSVGILGNTDNPLKKRRGRPPKNYAALASYDSAIKGSKPEGKTKADESQIDYVADDGNLGKSLDSVANCGNASDLNAENSEHDALPENGGTETGGTQTKQDSTMSMGVMDTVAPIPVVRLDINDPFTFTSDEEPDVRETVASKIGNSVGHVTKEVTSGPSAEPKTEGMNSKFSASGTGIKRRKRKTKTRSNSNSPAEPGSTYPSTKRRRGRPSKLSMGTSDEKSKYLTKQLGDPKVDESRRVYASGNVVLLKSKDALIEGRNGPYMTADLKVSRPVVLENNITNSTPDSMRMGTKEDVALAQNSSKPITGGLRLGSSTGLKFKFKTCGSEPQLRRKRSNEITSSPSEQVNKDGSVKRPRGRPPCKFKFEAPKPEGGSNPRAVGQHKACDSAGAVEPGAEIIHKADQVSIGNSSGPVFKDDSTNMNNVPKDPVPSDVGMKEKHNSPRIADNVVGNHFVANKTGI
ncbi:unnamed protein product [Rhodiola kirilowii]